MNKLEYILITLIIALLFTIPVVSITRQSKIAKENNYITDREWCQQQGGRYVDNVFSADCWINNESFGKPGSRVK